MKYKDEPRDLEVYALYPRKAGKRAALRAIQNARIRLHDGEHEKPMHWEDAQKFLLDKTRQFANSPAGNREAYTPHPSTFFNQSRYLDHEIEWYRVNEQERLAALNQVGVWRPE